MTSLRQSATNLFILASPVSFKPMAETKLLKAGIYPNHASPLTTFQNIPTGLFFKRRRPD
jgi:hypothetical protein